MMSGEHTAGQLRYLIEQGYIQQIHVYRFADDKLGHHSKDWSFGHEYIQIGDQPYPLTRLVTFNVINYSLHLYF